jgi:hypothetical protein
VSKKVTKKLFGCKNAVRLRLPLNGLQPIRNFILRLRQLRIKIIAWRINSLHNQMPKEQESFLGNVLANEVMKSTRYKRYKRTLAMGRGYKTS